MPQKPTKSNQCNYCLIGVLKQLRKQPSSFYEAGVNALGEMWNNTIEEEDFAHGHIWNPNTWCSSSYSFCVSTTKPVAIKELILNFDRHEYLNQLSCQFLFNLRLSYLWGRVD